MRVVKIDCRLLQREGLAVPASGSVTAAWVASALDRHQIPDGFPFVLDDDGTIAGCRHLNQYLLDALGQNAFDLGSMRQFHVYHLARLLRFVRRHRAVRCAETLGIPVED